MEGINLQSLKTCNNRVVWESLDLKYIITAWSGKQFISNFMYITFVLYVHTLFKYNQHVCKHH